MSEETTAWWKRPWVWFAAAAGLLGSALLFLLTLGGKGGRKVVRPDGLEDQPPDRPELPDVPKIPKAPDVSTTPSDDYEEETRKIERSTSVVDDLNNRFK